MVIETNTTQIVFETQSFPLFTEKMKETHVNTHKAVFSLMPVVFHTCLHEDAFSNEER